MNHSVSKNKDQQQYYPINILYITCFRNNLYSNLELTTQAMNIWKQK